MALHIILFYYYYLISSKLYRKILLQIVIKMENRPSKKIKSTGHMHCPVLPSFLYRAKNQNTGLSGIWQPSESDISIDSKVGGCILEDRDQDISCRSSRLECKLVRELMNHGRRDESSIDVGVDYQTWRDCRFERRRHVSCPSKEMLAYCLLKASVVSTDIHSVLNRAWTFCDLP